MAACSPEIPRKSCRIQACHRLASQYRRSSARACLGPPRTNPSTRTAPFMAPALVPVTPMMSIVASSSSRSSTPQVNAPCDPPPCNAKATLGRPGTAAAVCTSVSDDLSTVGAATMPSATGNPSSAPRREIFSDLNLPIMSSASRYKEKPWKHVRYQRPGRAARDWPLSVVSKPLTSFSSVTVLLVSPPRARRRAR